MRLYRLRGSCKGRRRLDLIFPDLAVSLKTGHCQAFGPLSLQAPKEALPAGNLLTKQKHHISYI
jgi:hypothetical protein